MTQASRRDRGPFGDAVRWHRRLAGYTQQDLADISGLSLAAIRSYETGIRREPQAHSLRKLAKALNVSIEQLLTFQAPQPLINEWAQYHRPHIRSLLDNEK